MTFALQQKLMMTLLAASDDWQHASVFIDRFMAHGVSITDVTVRELVNAIREAQIGHGETVISTIRDGYKWSSDADEIRACAEYWRLRALSRLQTASYIMKAVNPSHQEELSL